MQGNSPDDSPFTPPPTCAGPTVLIALALGVLVWAGGHLAGWWPPSALDALLSTRAAVEKTVQAPLAQATHPAPPSHRQTSSARDESTDAPPPAWSRCEMGGRVVYSDTACQGRVVKSTSNTTGAALSVVPPVAIRPDDPAIQQTLPLVEASTPAPNRNFANAPDAKARQCRYLDAHILQLDVQARQPQSGPMQDWLRGERKAARDRQFALHC